MQSRLRSLSMVSLIGLAAGCPPKTRPVGPSSPAAQKEVVHELKGSAGTSLLVSESGWFAIVSRGGGQPSDFESLAAQAKTCIHSTCGTVASIDRVNAVCRLFGGGLFQIQIGGQLVIGQRAEQHILLAWPRGAAPDGVLNPLGVEAVMGLESGGVNPAPCDPVRDGAAGTTTAPGPAGSGIQPECTRPPTIPPRFCL